MITPRHQNILLPVSFHVHSIPGILLSPKRKKIYVIIYLLSELQGWLLDLKIDFSQVFEALHCVLF